MPASKTLSMAKKVDGPGWRGAVKDLAAFSRSLSASLAFWQEETCNSRMMA